MLAGGHEVVTEKGSNQLLPALEENERTLTLFNRTTLGVHGAQVVTPAAEWLLDNFYLIEEQIQMARRHLPRGYSRELPRLVRGPSAGFPRVYDLVLELISHVDAQIDAGSLSAFVAAYQTVTPLKLGELWAVPIMLRLGLIENLARVTTRLDARTAGSRSGGDVGGSPAGDGGEESVPPRGGGGGHGEGGCTHLQRVRGGVLPAVVAPESRCCISRAAGSSSGWRNKACPSSSSSIAKARTRRPTRFPSATASAACVS